MDYQALVLEAHQRAAAAVRENDRQFWLNIARAWSNLRAIDRSH